jgi:F0F1-type ATP synthase membrane subunit b/b'
MQGHGFGDLSGEDVIEALRVVRRTTPGLSHLLEPIALDNTGLPPVRPLPGESELDAAVRQLEHAVTLCGGPAFAPTHIGVGTVGRDTPPGWQSSGSLPLLDGDGGTEDFGLFDYPSQAEPGAPIGPAMYTTPGYTNGGPSNGTVVPPTTDEEEWASAESWGPAETSAWSPGDVDGPWANTDPWAPGGSAPVDPWAPGEPEAADGWAPGDAETAEPWPPSAPGPVDPGWPSETPAQSYAEEPSLAAPANDYAPAPSYQGTLSPPAIDDDEVQGLLDQVAEAASNGLTTVYAHALADARRLVEEVTNHAEAYREQSEAEGADIIELARKRATDIIADAEQEATEVVQAAQDRAAEEEKRAEKVIQDAEARAAQIVRQGERDASRKAQDAEVHAQSVRDEAERRMDEVHGARQELERLSNLLASFRGGEAPA